MRSLEIALFPLGLLVMLIVGAGPVFAAAAPATPNWTGDPVLGQQELEQQWPQVADATKAVGIRGVFRFALEASALRWHPERVEAALARARALQDLDPASKTYGNFKWRSDQERVFDLNAVEFSMQLAGLLRVRHADTLTPAARQLLDELMTTAIEALRRHEVKIEYTNIFVMKAWDFIAVGEGLGRPDVAAEGYRRFDEWLHYTARNGLGEFGAVTYYGVDLDSLALIAKFAGRAEARSAAEKAIRYMWTDLAANWWQGGDRMGGANSRSYDYVFGGGYTEAHTWTAGWLRQRPELESAGWLAGPHANLSELYDVCTWRPNPTWTESIRAEVPRTVVQRWGEGPEHLAVNWIGRHVSLASAGAGHGSDDRTLVANLGDSPAVPQLTLFMDGRGDPFGTKKTSNSAAQAKALHLTPFVATVQRGPEVLQLLSDEPLGPKSRRKPGELSCFLTHFTVPAAAEVWIDDTRTQPGYPEKPTLVPSTALISVRIGNAVIGLRFLLATTTEGKAAAVEFIEDAPGGVARRLTLVHSTAEPHGRASVVAWIRAAENLDDAAFAEWRKQLAAAKGQATLTNGSVRAEAAGLTGPLRIEADLVKAKRVVREGGEPAALLSVNGRDVGQAVLAEFLAK